MQRPYLARAVNRTDRSAHYLASNGANVDPAFLDTLYNAVTSAPFKKAAISAIASLADSYVG